jgi:hypothetical protein
VVTVMDGRDRGISSNHGGGGRRRDSRGDRHAKMECYKGGKMSHIARNCPVFCCADEDAVAMWAASVTRIRE